MLPALYQFQHAPCTQRVIKNDESNLKKKGVNKNYFRNLLSGNILDLDIQNTFLNSEIFYTKCIFNFVFWIFLFGMYFFIFLNYIYYFRFLNLE